ncbi:NAD(P)-dependent oxidoreductase [Methylomonas sp. AM2-LC]|uniref:NAD-dependent epimerase/dehydratase family protein n=1 Tax=Methylomonas sp. AM2-LC TaxID=3153301 RepID=UPI003263CC76
MRIAILGASSEIAKDLIFAYSETNDIKLYLFARNADKVNAWLLSVGLAGRYVAASFTEFGLQEYDAIINFVGVGNPVKAQALGNSIFDITLRFDELVLDYLQTHENCRYLFLSSGAVYGSGFKKPATQETVANIPVNNLTPHDWYGVAKLYAECRHRSFPTLSIVDIRVFNYFSHTQDLSARFLITDILRAIRDNTILKTSPDYIVRDFLHPSDFYGLVQALLSAPPANDVVDCYSRSPIDKPTLLATMQEKFQLQYEVAEAAGVNATGNKAHYYSLNHKASAFGYSPKYSSLEGVLLESQLIIEHSLI